MNPQPFASKQEGLYHYNKWLRNTISIAISSNKIQWTLQSPGLGEKREFTSPFPVKKINRY